MKKAILVPLLILLTHAAICSQPTGTEPPDRYYVSFTTAEPGIIYVKADLVLKDSLLYMSPFGPMPKRWPQYIQNLTVTGQGGQPLPVHLTEEGSWKVSTTEIGKHIELAYEMVLDHEEVQWPGGIDGVAYRRGWGIMASGRSLFVMNGKDKKGILVHVEAPEGWNVSTSWKAGDGSGKTFRVPNLLNLQESFVVAGTHEVADITREGFTLKFVLGGEKIIAEKSRYVQVASGVMDFYIDLMGGTPKPAPGMELGHSLVLISQSRMVDGEVIGNHLSMFMNPEGSPMDQMSGWFMFAHEFFHLWNGKTLRYVDTTTDWFKEGISNYYTIKALRQIGFIDDAMVFGILNNLFYQRYIQDPGYGTLSPSRAASGFDKDNHWGLVYGGGLFAGIAMDMEIRNRTDNAASLDDLMRNLYRQYGGTQGLIGQEELLRRANLLGRTDFAGFMAQHIQGPEPIPLGPYLKFAGISVDTAGGQLQLTHNPEKSTLQAAIWEGFLGGTQGQ